MLNPSGLLERAAMTWQAPGSRGGSGGEKAHELPVGSEGRGGHEEEGLGVELVAGNQVVI